jgi:RimJ/RimL family protein N-acetyltransferase
MIDGTHCFIRTTEADDAPVLFTIYDRTYPRAGLLDRRHEAVMPTVRELQMTLEKEKGVKGVLFTVEDRQGVIQGFCGLRALDHEAKFTELNLFFLEDASYSSPMATEVFQFLKTRAFSTWKLNKLTASCLDNESAFREFLLSEGFESNGIQREAFFGQGRWHNLEAFSLYPS